jgi:hypothetical protein
MSPKEVARMWVRSHAAVRSVSTRFPDGSAAAGGWSSGVRGYETNHTN